MMLNTAVTATRTLYARWRSRLHPGIISGTVESTPLSQQITRWLGDWRHGDDAARDRLFAVVQPQLQQIAARFLHHERADHTLEPNALVNELCLRMLGAQPITYNDRAHFFAVAAQTMRRILIDHARARVADKRGGVQQRVSLSAVDGWNPVARSEDLLALDEVLAKLEKADPRAAHVVELRFFGGLSEEEVAAALGVSVITVKRDWRAARAWLVGKLSGRQRAPSRSSTSPT
jgi:RNA polymerase sigma-70 factor, ECF subfamily